VHEENVEAVGERVDVVGRHALDLWSRYYKTPLRQKSWGTCTPAGFDRTAQILIGM
jgi:hypothetical protein